MSQVPLKPPSGRSLISVVVFVVIIFLVLTNWPFVQVNPGQRGLVIRLGQLQERTLEEGLHFRIPFVDDIRRVSVRIRKDEVLANAASKDAQQVNTQIAVSWRIKSDKVTDVYRQIGDEQLVFDGIVAPAVAEVVKASTAQKTAEETLQKREELKNDIDKKLTDRLAKYGLVLEGVSIIDVNFSPEFNAAIEAKQVAEQESKRAKFVADKAEQDANAAINRARGEAEAQRLLQQSLNDQLLRKLWIEKWNGELPQVVSDDSSILLDVPSTR